MFLPVETADASKKPATKPVSEGGRGGKPPEGNLIGQPGATTRSVQYSTLIWTKQEHSADRWAASEAKRQAASRPLQLILHLQAIGDRRVYGFDTICRLCIRHHMTATRIFYDRSIIPTGHSRMVIWSVPEPVKKRASS